MKAEEFVTEGPLDRIKGAVQGFKSGGLAGATAGFQAGGGAAVTDRRTAATASRIFDTWSQQLKALPAGSDIAAALKDFAEQTFRADIPPGSTKVPDPQNITATDYGKMKEYLTKRSAEIFAPRASSQIPAGHGAPKQDTTVDVRGNTYSFTKSTGKWTDAAGREVAIPGDIELLNQTAYSTASTPSQPAPSQPTAASIAAAIPANLARDVIAQLLQLHGTGGGAPRP